MKPFLNFTETSTCVVCVPQTPLISVLHYNESLLLQEHIYLHYGSILYGLSTPNTKFQQYAQLVSTAVIYHLKEGFN